MSTFKTTVQRGSSPNEATKLAAKRLGLNPKHVLSAKHMRGSGRDAVWRIEFGPLQGSAARRKKKLTWSEPVTRRLHEPITRTTHASGVHLPVDKSPRAIAQAALALTGGNRDAAARLLSAYIERKGDRLDNATRNRLRNATAMLTLHRHPLLGDTRKVWHVTPKGRMALAEAASSGSVSTGHVHSTATLRALERVGLLRVSYAGKERTTYVLTDRARSYV